MDQFLGQVLCDRYQIQSLLGRQTGRRTFLATDLETQSMVVVKLLLFNPDFTWDDLKLFEREADTLKSLSHSAIPKYLDSFEVGTELGRGFALVQSYINAQSLQEWIQSGRTFSEAELKTIARDLLEILDYLHNRQPSVVHRDIKPSNILLGDRSGNSPGSVYLVDFGSVQTIAQGGTVTVVGTYGYMPPEQFGGRTSPASDLYALGATLIYLATKQHPDQLPQREMRILFEEHVNLSFHLINWLVALIEPSTALRLNSAKQALEALSSLQASGLTIGAKPIGSRIQVTKTSQSLEILIPPRGFYPGLIFLIGFAIAWNSFLWVWYGTAFANWNSGGWFAALFAIVHLGAGVGLTWGILFALLGAIRLHITQYRISMYPEILGLRLYPRLSAARQDIVKVEITHLLYKKDSEGNNFEVPPRIEIWAGVTKFELGGNGSNSRRILASPEIDWLAKELSIWLNLPVTKER